MKSDHSKLPQATAYPKLETEAQSLIDPDSGEPMTVTRSRRGILVEENRCFSTPKGMRSALEQLGASPREEFEAICESLRNFLNRNGLPSDRQPVWIKIGDEEWKELIKCGDPPNDVPVQYARWSARLSMLTEPLSVERCAGEALQALAALLRCDATDEQLWRFRKVLDTYVNFRLSLLNSMADAGAKAHKSRRLGPISRSTKAAASRQIIMIIAKDYWLSHPAYRGDASNTALAIAPPVNDELAKTGLRPLRSATIANHIRQGIAADLREMAN